MVISVVALVNAFYKDMSVTDLTTVEMDLMKSIAVSNYVYIVNTWLCAYMYIVCTHMQHTVHMWSMYNNNNYMLN